MASWFEVEQPLEIDLGSGKGRFLLEHARTHPAINFLGIERLRGRVNRVAATGARLGLKNMRMLRIEGGYAMRFLVPDQCVRTYYIFFPDPWPKKKHWHNRIIHPSFLDALYRTLEPGGAVHFATDHLPYFYEAVDVFEADERFSRIEPFQPEETERSDFELLFLDGKAIGRYSFARAD